MVKITALRCEDMEEPIGITGSNFRVSWQLVSDQRNVVQQMFRVCVRRKEEHFCDEENDIFPEKKGYRSGKVVYDSGERKESSSFCILPDIFKESFARYYWDVSVKIRGKEEWIYSGCSYFEMGIVNSADWRAIWIEPDQRTVQKEEEYIMRQEQQIREDKLTPCPLLRKEFLVRKQIQKARIYATAHGLYRLELNGGRVGDYELAPEVTSYGSYLQVQAYDITELLCIGTNCIGAVLAPGWWAGRIGMFGHSVQYGDKLALLMQMEIWYKDGSRETIGSDRTFLSIAEGPWIYSELYIGEKFDAGKQISNWSIAGVTSESRASDKKWKPSREKKFSFSNLTGQNAPHMKVAECSQDVEIYTSEKGELIIDCKQIRSGNAAMNLKAAPFASIKLYYFEETDKDGNFLFPKLDGCNSQQTDTFVLDETGKGYYEPWFTTHGYRYIYVVSDQGPVEVSNITARLIASDVAVTAQIRTSDQRLNQLQKNIEWTFRSNATATLTDNPDRERAGWTGDLQMIGPALCYNLDMKAFLRRWLEEARLEQKPDGRMPMVIPAWPCYENEKVFMNNKCPGWGDVIVILPWLMYERYGDIRVLRENYDAMKKYVDFVKERAKRANPEDVHEEMNNIPFVPWKIDCTATAKTPQAKKNFQYLWNTDYGYGDWLTPSACWDEEKQQFNYYCQALCWLTGTYYYAYSTEILMKIAEVLGEEADAAYYKDLISKIRNAAIEEFYKTGLIINSEYMGAQILALHMKFYPQDEKQKLLDRILELWKEKGLDTGFSSTKVVFDILSENGYEGVAYQELLNDQFPSWLYEVGQGATGVWESMQAISPDGTRNAVSFIQPGYCSVGNWMMEGMCGIRPMKPGFEKISIHPYITEHLSMAEGIYHSVKGDICCKWEKIDDRTEIIVSIPANTSAVVYLPEAKAENVTESGKPICCDKEKRIIFQGKYGISVEVGSGTYQFCII